MSDRIELLINGESKSISAGQTISQLLNELDFDARRVAVEVNLDVVPREQHGQRQLEAGDRVEVVSLVGGG